MHSKTGKDEIIDYLTDESHMFNADPALVEAVYLPTSENELAALVKHCNETGKKLTISGAGTGITGSRVAMHGGAIASMENFLGPTPKPEMEEIRFMALGGRALLYLDRENMRATCAPGISLLDLSKALPHDLFYPPDPTEQSAQLGGTLATNASGARSFFYGATRKWIEGIRAILPDGERLAVRRGETVAGIDNVLAFESEGGRSYSVKIPRYNMPKLKNAAGIYSREGMDLVDLFIGSEGLFGVITEIEIKLARKPGNIISDIAFFKGEGEAVSFVNSLRPLKSRGILSIEYFNHSSLDFIREEFPDIGHEARAGVFVELSDGDPELLSDLAALLDVGASLEDWLAINRLDQQDLKEFRHALPDRVNSYLKAHQSYKLGTDLVVPQGRFEEMMEHYRHVGELFRSQFPRDGAHYVIFGHIGDSHVHFNFITRSEKELRYAKKLYVEMARTALQFGGTISGEHGIGKKTMPVDGKDMPYLEIMYGRDGLLEIARAKKALDPELIMNIGNMVPPEYYRWA